MWVLSFLSILFCAAPCSGYYGPVTRLEAAALGTLASLVLHKQPLLISEQSSGHFMESSSAQGSRGPAVLRRALSGFDLNMISSREPGAGRSMAFDSTRALSGPVHLFGGRAATERMMRSLSCPDMLTTTRLRRNAMGQLGDPAPARAHLGLRGSGGNSRDTTGTLALALPSQLYSRMNPLARPRCILYSHLVKRAMPTRPGTSHTAVCRAAVEDRGMGGAAGGAEDTPVDMEYQAPQPADRAAAVLMGALAAVAPLIAARLSVVPNSPVPGPAWRAAVWACGRCVVGAGLGWYLARERRQAARLASGLI